MSETSEEQEEWTEEDGGDSAAADEGEAPAAGAPRSRELSFGTMANRNLQRARKSVMSKGEGEAEDESKAQFLVQSATVYAILDLADAVRKQAK
jgi:hypothetical protein